MDASYNAQLVAGRDRPITETFARQRARLRNFIRRRVGNPADAEDILQDVFYELVEATAPIEQVGAWLFTVARHRITDLFRRKKAEALDAFDADDGDLYDLLPTDEAGPEAAYARRLLLEELDAALDELPAEQRAIFVAHELEGRTFKALARESGVPLNTLLARKRYAVLHLRRRLQAIHDEFVES
jgi:RNA polymerase sigma factor (sigma-70 family)